MGESETAKMERLLREGLDYFGVGDVAKAVCCWEDVLRLDPGHAEALDYLQAAGSRGEAPDPETDAGPARAAAPEVASAESDSPAGSLVEEARTRLEAEDLEGALDLFRAAADLEPDRIEVEGYIDAIRSQLLQTYRKRVGESGAVPELLIQPSAITRYQLPADAGFVLSQVDGETTVEQLIALSGMDAFEALRILNDLIDAGIVGLRA
jgi:tetratricopeptide (TPR) repeat protein